MESGISKSSNHQVAVIGSGIAGLSASWFLAKKGFRVTIYEAGTDSGLAAHSLNLGQSVFNSDGEIWGDVPSRMFNASLWPTVTRLYEDAGVEFEPVDHRQSFFDQNRGLFLKVSLPYRFGEILKNTFNRRAKDIANQLEEFQAKGEQDLKNHDFDSITFGEYLAVAKNPFDGPFLNQFLIPALTSTVFTCPKDHLLNYPSRVVLDALQKIVNQNSPLMRTVLGSREAAKRLLKVAHEVNFSTSVLSVHDCETTATIRTRDGIREFDHVIVATQANHASEMVNVSWPDASELLSKFQYVDVPVVVHTDDSLMPKRKQDWSTFNFQTNVQSQESSCTVWMNRFHKQWPEASNVFHTIFPSVPINPDSMIASARLQRPIVSLESRSILESLKALQGDRRIWFVGSYATAGVPLLESAAGSSLNVSTQIASYRTPSTSQSTNAR